MSARLRTSWWDALRAQRVECFEGPTGRYHKITTDHHAALRAREHLDETAVVPPLLAPCDCRLRPTHGSSIR